MKRSLILTLAATGALGLTACGSEGASTDVAGNTTGTDPMGAQPVGKPLDKAFPFDVQTNGPPLSHEDPGEIRQANGVVYLPGDMTKLADGPLPTGQTGLENLSGNPPHDDRTPRTRAAYGDGQPYSLVGLVQTGWGGFCTGFLVGSRIVMTAGHCLGGQSTGWAPNVTFTPRFDANSGNTGPWGTFTSQSSIVPSGWANCTPGSNLCQPYDKGWFVLTKSPNIGYFGDVVLPTTTPYGGLKTLGYGQDLPRNLYYTDTLDWIDPIASEKSWRWLYNDWENIFCGLDVAGGQSGSPVSSNYAPYQNWWITAIITASSGYNGSDPNNKWPTLLERIDPGDIQVISNLRSQNP